MSLLAKNGAKKLIDERRWCEVPFARPLGGFEDSKLVVEHVT